MHEEEDRVSETVYIQKACIHAQYVTCYNNMDLKLSVVTQTFPLPSKSLVMQDYIFHNLITQSALSIV